MRLMSEMSENQFLKTALLSLYIFCLLITALHSFPQCPGPAIPCHRPRTWSIPVKYSHPRRHCPHPADLSGLAMGGHSSHSHGKVLCLPWYPSPYTALKVFLLLLPCQDFLLFSNSLRSKGRASSLCQKLCEYAVRTNVCPKLFPR